MSDRGDTSAYKRTAVVRPPGLLDRDREIAALELAIERADDGDGSLVVIEAHAGLGKSRLLGEATELAASRGQHVLQKSFSRALPPWRGRWSSRAVPQPRPRAASSRCCTGSTG